MYTSSEANRIIKRAKSAEIQKALTHAARILTHSTSEEDRRAAKQTFISLSSFGDGMGGPALAVKERQKDPLASKNKVGKGLQDLLYTSGVYYFGPLFQENGDLETPLRERDKMLSSLEAGGYEISAFKYLKNEQLDILFTKLLETGLIAASGIAKSISA